MIILITARMGSKRLPGKVMADVCGKPMLQRLIERVSGANLPIAVCSSMADENQPIGELCRKLGISYIRGEEKDVMDRLIMAAAITIHNDIVRVTGDNPLTDPELIKLMVTAHKKRKANYTYTVGPPQGTKPEIINVAALKQCHEFVTAPELRENMTPALKMMDNKVCLPCHCDYYAPELRLTVDYQEDLDRIRQIYDAYDGKPPSLPEIIKYCNGK